jgi:hypothetical protein
MMATNGKPEQNGGSESKRRAEDGKITEPGRAGRE